MNKYILKLKTHSHTHTSIPHSSLKKAHNCYNIHNIVHFARYLSRYHGSRVHIAGCKGISLSYNRCIRIHSYDRVHFAQYKWGVRVHH